MITNSTFETLLMELSATRTAYEHLRVNNGPLAERAATLTRLHDLRSEIATLRSAS